MMQRVGSTVHRPHSRIEGASVSWKIEFETQGIEVALTPHQKALSRLGFPLADVIEEHLLAFREYLVREQMQTVLSFSPNKRVGVPVNKSQRIFCCCCQCITFLEQNFIFIDLFKQGFGGSVPML
jgi:hypothetical protein